MAPSHVLIIDDEADIRELIEITLGRMGLETQSAATLAEGREMLDAQRFDLCLTDMRLPDGNGIDLVHHIQSQCPDTPVAVITAYGNTQAAVESLKAGAFDFVSKPVDIHVLRRLVDQALKLEHNGERIRKASSMTQKLLGNAPTVERLRKTIDKLARSQAPVCITGESGTGKELVARSIHAQGPRGTMPFVPVNCGAIPDELMESEFFGHVKGAFTGASRDKDGLFVSADGGTLFLDEIAELPLHMQVKLLRAIQERAVRPVGEEREVSVDVRIICATHKDLATLVASGQFREDLYYRLNVIEVHVPPLRERRDDIPLLAEHTLAELGEQMGLARTPHLTEEAVQTLKNYEFPGNVRELENILERAVTLCEDETIGPDLLRLETPLANDDSASNDPAAEFEPGEQPLEDYVEAVERTAIQKALAAAGHNKTKAAKLLGLSFRSLRYRLKKLGID